MHILNSATYEMFRKNASEKNLTFLTPFRNQTVDSFSKNSKLSLHFRSISEEIAVKL
jgi:hypothetical protein